MCRQGPASLLSTSTDIDAPNSMDFAFMKKARGTQNLKAHFQDLAMKRVPSKKILQIQNHKLERQVCAYEVGRKSGGICVEIMLSVPTSAVYACYHLLVIIASFDIVMMDARFSFWRTRLTPSATSYL
jgi:hypothetical protein